METRGERMLALRRRRMAASPPLLRGGFRPFFLGGSLWALVALTLWVMALSGTITLPSALPPLAWHRHEMLFGFVGAAVAGFLLTAIPNWTGRLPIAGMPLAALFGLWLAARLAVLFSGATGNAAAAALDVGFYLLLAALAAGEVLAAKNRNLPIVGLVLLFGIANALDHAGAAGWIADEGLGWRAGLALVLLMIAVIGGRIVPSFTRNWLAKRGVEQGLPGQPGRFDLAVVALTGVALLGWVGWPGNGPAGWLLVLAGILQLVRLARWNGIRTLPDPLVWILHLGYLWVPVGLALLGASVAGLPIPSAAAVHAVTAGAMATMILAVMTRASLGHTGRVLAADRPTQAIYALVTLGALARVATPLMPVDYMAGMHLSAGLWGAAFALFLLRYGPILCAPRPDGRL